MKTTNHVTVITGASDGIGAELACQLAHRKAPLVLAGRDQVRLDAVGRHCESVGCPVRVVRTDVSVEADCRHLIQTALNVFGRIDTLVNNAGVSGHARLDEVKETGWYVRMMTVNFFGTLWCTHAALNALKASRGRVVNVSSLAGRFGVPGRTAYGASKYAVAGFSEALRVELADDGVSVTVIYPGVVDTQIRFNGYGADGRPAGRSALKDDKAMPVDECVRQMIAAIDGRKRELVMTAKGRIGLWLKLIAPSLVDRMAQAALKADARRSAATTSTTS